MIHDWGWPQQTYLDNIQDYPKEKYELTIRGIAFNICTLLIDHVHTYNSGWHPHVHIIQESIYTTVSQIPSLFFLEVGGVVVV